MAGEVELPLVVRNTPDMTLVISVVNPRQRIKRSPEEVLTDIAEVFSFCNASKSDLAFFPELYTTGYQMSRSKFVEYTVLYEKEKLNSRIADLANRFKVAVLYGYAEYDSQSDKVSNCARFYDPMTRLDFVHSRDDYSSANSIFNRGSNSAPIFTWKYGARIAFGICLETSKVEEVCGKYKDRCDILFSLSTRSNSVIPQPRFIQSQHMFFMHNYYNEHNSDKCLIAEVNLLKLPRFKARDQQELEDKHSANKVSASVKFASKSPEKKKQPVKKAKKRKTNWNF
ncbi:uncharacterized protein LOC142338282 [Convolutriloba macropyga]|uniref:uncharacterized protein LOC142338282 n=1 Tax=Convolutriloba macropyga TaxID=536237 RepID=UPI003F5288BD